MGHRCHCYGFPHAGGGQPPVDSPGASVSQRASGWDSVPMTKTLQTLRRAFSDLVAEDRAGFKRVDASPVRPDDASWLAR